MLDLNKGKEEFLKYVKNYDENEVHINRKIYHSLRVMEISEQIAKNVCKNDEEVEIATLIGLLHDIARFEQFTMYKTFNDLRSIDHGDLGIKILQKDNYLRKYIASNEYDEIILKAIKNHNKFIIENNCSEKEEMFCKIIRDADKVDIFFEATEMFWNSEIKDIEESEITDYVYESVKNFKTIKRRKDVELKNSDSVCFILDLLFDINYAESLRIIFDNDYVNKIINRFDFKKEITKERMENIRNICNNYIKSKLND